MRQDDDLTYMQLAVQAARAALTIGEVPIGAVLVVNGQVMAQTHNLRERDQDPTAHAEVLAIREAAARLGSWRMNGATLYVTLEPCAMCAGAMILARISRLVFGPMDPKAGACGSLFNIPEERRLNHRVEVTSGVCATESQALLQDFFRRLRSGDPQPTMTTSTR